MGKSYSHLSNFAKKYILKLTRRCFNVNDICNIYEIDRSTYYRFIKKIKQMYNEEKIKLIPKVQKIQEGADNNKIIQNYIYENNILNILNDNDININYEIGRRQNKKEKNLISDVLTKIIKEDNTLTLKQMSLKILDEHKIKVSKSTIFYRLHKMDIIYKKKIVKPLLTNEHLNCRLNWAIFYQYFNWDTVMWTDETTISNDCNTTNKVWMHKDAQEYKRIVQKRLKINVWGYIMKNKKLCIEIFDETMKSDKYISVLENKISEYKEQFKLKKNIFQQDNARYHTSYKMIKYFSDNQIEVMLWPPNSPDLNPIENVWNLIKRQLGKRYYKTICEMKQYTLEIANNLSVEIINSLISSMDNRIESLFDNNFDSINY